MIDFIIFPDRWLVMENTFRPPWYHRNIASEFMGNVYGMTDTKASGFLPGGASLHNCMVPHGPDAISFDKAMATDTSQPQKFSGALSVMFETRLMIRPTRYALESQQLQADYSKSWDGLQKRFKP